MSKREEDGETVADRLKKLIKSTPPREGRRSRIGHISIEDFAALLGTSKQRIIEWRDGDAYPDRLNRERLAAVSDGRYTADDFKGPTTRENRDQVAALRAEIVDVKKELDAAQDGQRGLLRRVEVLEKAAGLRSGSRPPGPARRRDEEG